MKQYSTLFDILDLALFEKWMAEAERQESEHFKNSIDKIKNELAENMDDEQIELLGKFKIAVENRMIDLHLQIFIRILNMGVKIGMELGRAFENIDNGSFRNT